MRKMVKSCPVRCGRMSAVLAALLLVLVLGACSHAGAVSRDLSSGAGAGSSLSALSGSSAGQGGSVEGSSTRQESSAGESTAGEVVVFVCGQVKNPGVYTLPSGSRIYEAVNAAGGYGTDADPSYLNQAQVLVDAQRVEVPTVQEAKELRAQGQSPDAQAQSASAGTPAQESGSATQSGGESGGKINLNTAGVEELTQIPGIGESRAQAIIEYREQNGAFGSIEDIMKIPGIKQATFDKMKDRITV